MDPDEEIAPVEERGFKYPYLKKGSGAVFQTPPTQQLQDVLKQRNSLLQKREKKYYNRDRAKKFIHVCSGEDDVEDRLKQEE